MKYTFKLKRVASSQAGFLTFKPTTNPTDLYSSKRKRVNKNKKKNWNKHTDITDVEEFLEDIRHQERTTGGLLAEKPDDSLFFVDIGLPKKTEEEPEEGKKRKGKASRPLRIDLILQPDSRVPAPKDVLAYQQPNAKKLRRSAQRAEQLAANATEPRKQKLLLNRRPVRRTTKKAATEFIIFVSQPIALFCCRVQALLQDAHDIEVVKKKQEDKIERQLAYNKDDRATEVCGNEDNDEDFASGIDEEEEDGAVGAIAVAQKKTERQRKRERAEKVKVYLNLCFKQQQLFQLRTIKASISKQDQKTKSKQIQRKAKQEEQKSQPRRLGRLKFQPQDMEVQLSDELAGSLRRLKPEGSVLKDRFKSLQKRNLIEPRERAKFKRRLKVKYQEKRAFREIT
uniref:Ribosome biogenesis protein NOP53 n=1 Tax=Neogobius melanostomus TaxID=47308 RepID=A0A8C6UTG1_9GOBI